MTRLLAIDTSGWSTGVALVEQADPARPPETVAELSVDLDGSHAAPLLRRLDWLIAEAGWSRNDLDGFVACRGPGSFTGVRIGLGTIRGLGVAAEAPCVGIGTLEAAAEAVGASEALRVPILTAGRGEIYSAVYDASSSPPTELLAPWVGPAAQTLEGMVSDARAIFFGSGANELRPRVDDREHWRIANTPLGIAAAAGRICLLRGLATDGADSGMSPLYVRPPDAIVGRRR